MGYNVISTFKIAARIHKTQKCVFLRQASTGIGSWVRLQVYFNKIILIYLSSYYLGSKMIIDVLLFSFSDRDPNN